MTGAHSCPADKQCDNTLGSYDCVTSNMSHVASTGLVATTRTASVTATTRITSSTIPTAAPSSAPTAVASGTVEVTPTDFVPGVYRPTAPASGVKTPVLLAVVIAVITILLIGGLLVACAKFCHRKTMPLSTSRHSSSTATSTQIARSSVHVTNAMYGVATSAGASSDARVVENANYSTLLHGPHTQQHDAQTPNATCNADSHSPQPGLLDASSAHLTLRPEYRALRGCNEAGYSPDNTALQDQDVENVRLTGSYSLAGPPTLNRSSKGNTTNH